MILLGHHSNIGPSLTFQPPHIAGCQGYFINHVVASGPVYWMPKFDFTKFLKYNKKFRITTFFTVPPIYLLIAKSPLMTDQFESGACDDCRSTNGLVTAAARFKEARMLYQPDMGLKRDYRARYCDAVGLE